MVDGSQLRPLDPRWRLALVAVRRALGILAKAIDDILAASIA